MEFFSTKSFKYSIGWSGGFIRLLEGREDERAEYRHRIGGEVHFSLPEGTGWLLEMEVPAIRVPRGWEAFLKRRGGILVTIASESEWFCIMRSNRPKFWTALGWNPMASFFATCIWVHPTKVSV